MQFNTYISKLFFEGTWACAYRVLDDHDKKQLTVDHNIYKYKVISVKRKYCIADPFLVKYEGKMYFYCEVIHRHKSKGMIGVGEFIDRKPTGIKLLKELNCHTSYPFIFRYDNKWYMISETKGNKTVELYRETEFPYHWDLDTVLLSGKEYVDTTVYSKDGELFIFLYHPGNETENRTLSIGKLNMVERSIEYLKEVVRYEKKIGRPAGGILDFGQRMIRPTQYGINQYGEKIIYKEFVGLNNEYIESDCGSLSVKSILLNKKYKVTGIHTINRCDDYEIIDIYFKRFRPMRPIETALKKFKIGGYKFYERSERE